MYLNVIMRKLMYVYISCYYRDICLDFQTVFYTSNNNILELNVNFPIYFSKQIHQFGFYCVL